MFKKGGPENEEGRRWKVAMHLHDGALRCSPHLPTIAALDPGKPAFRSPDTAGLAET
jgi:hypothetical protein